MRRLLIAASAAALLGSAAVAFAQSPGDEKQQPDGGGRSGPSMQQGKAPSGGQGANAPSQGPSWEQTRPDGNRQAQDQDQDQDRGSADNAGGNDKNGGSQKQAGDSDQGRKRAGSDNKGPSGKQTGTNTNDDGSRNNTAKSRDDKSGGQTETDANEAGSSKESADRNRNDQQQAADQNKGRDKGDKGGKDKIKISSEQKTKISTAFKSEDFDRARVNIHIDVAVGTTLPRSVHLYPVPDYIIAIEPEYASFDYVVIDGRVCIVDPATYEIVTVIDRGPQVAGYKHEGGGHGGGGSLTLTDQEKTFILEHVDKDKFRAGSDISISVGEPLPGSVELFTFPDAVISEIPKVKDFKFIVIEGDVVIAQPSDRDVVLRISG